MSMDELIAVEEKIKGGFIDQAVGFAEIADDQLYRSAGYDTFESYCDERANCGANYGWKMVKAGKNVQRLIESGIGQIWLPSNERQARELGRAGEEKLEHAAQVVYDRAPKKNGEAVITSDHIRETLIHDKIVPPPRQKTEAEKRELEDRRRLRAINGACRQVADLKGEISAKQAYRKFGDDLFTSAYEEAVAYLLELEELRNDSS